jgi:hypothetical protein
VNILITIQDWFDGKNIVQTRQAIQIPFILRRVMDDMSTRIDILPNTTSGGISYNFRKGIIEKERFEPYREPFDKYNSELGSKFVHGHVAYCIGNTGSHDTPKLRQFISTLIVGNISDTQLPVTIRFGSPSFVTKTVYNGFCKLGEEYQKGRSGCTLKKRTN